MKYKFDQNIKTIGNIDRLATVDEISHEPMIFGGSTSFCQGKLARKVINFLFEKVPILYAHEAAGNISIDTRSTMTMKGQYPSIPGWHCDFVPRNEVTGKPELSRIDSKMKHYMCVISSVENHSCTEFVIDSPELEFDYDSVIPIWGQLDTKITTGNYITKFIEPGEIIEFDQKSIHRASPTQNPGWRFFFRLTVGKRPRNEIRSQVQVYSPIGEGW